MSAENGSLKGTGAATELVTAEGVRDDGDAQKRRASSPPSADERAKSPKRMKLGKNDADDKEPAKSPAETREPPTDRRQIASAEERKRGKRLFGGLLSTLSQTSTSSQQRRRQEIERRQHARVHQRRNEDGKHQTEKLSKLRAVRQVEQLKFDEQAMQTRHSNLLATARFLHTRNEPKIYYLPWDTTNEQVDTIKAQIRDAEDTIDREVGDFERRKGQRMKALGISPMAKTSEPRDDRDGKADVDQTTDRPPPDSAARPASHSNKVGHEKDNDEAGDVMVEEAEDTVIY